MPDGGAITNISVATTEKWKDKSGEKQEKTEWHRVAFFGKLAEIAGEYLKKGSQVYVEGRLQTRKWQDKDGADSYTTEIVADRMQMLGSRQGMGGGGRDRGECRRRERERRVGGGAPRPSPRREEPAGSSTTSRTTSRSSLSGPRLRGPQDASVPEARRDLAAVLRQLAHDGLLQRDVLLGRARGACVHAKLRRPSCLAGIEAGIQIQHLQQVDDRRPVVPASALLRGHLREHGFDVDIGERRTRSGSRGRRGGRHRRLSVVDDVGPDAWPRSLSRILLKKLMARFRFG